MPELSRAARIGTVARGGASVDDAQATLCARVFGCHAAGEPENVAGTTPAEDLDPGE